MDPLQAALDQIPQYRNIDCANARALIKGYHNYHKDHSFKTLMVEQEFSIPIRNPDTNRPTRSFRYAGKIDGLIERNRTPILLEHKTANMQIGEDSNYIKRLRIDSQVTKYVLALRIMGYPVIQCLYDIVKKPSIKQKIKESIESYELRLEEDCATYPYKYFNWHFTSRTDSDLIEEASSLYCSQAEIRKAIRNNDVRKNDKACLDWNVACPFLGYCCGIVKEEELKKSEKINPELSNECGNIITHSRIATFNQCRQKHDLIYSKGYSATKNQSQDFGTLIHKALAAWWSCFSSDSHIG